MPKSTYWSNKVLDAELSAAALPSIPTLYFALFVGDPLGAGTEVSGNNYGRIGQTNNATNFPAASGGSKTNGTQVTFATPSGSWGTPDHYALCDSLSGGNILRAASLTTPRAIGLNDTVDFPIGSLSFSES
jgi:hypothetical protein